MIRFKRVQVTVLAVLPIACAAQLHPRPQLSRTAQAQKQARGGQGAASPIATPPAIPEQPFIRTIYNWGDDVAVITDKASRKGWIYSLAIVDRRTSRIVPFRAVACDSYDDVGYSKQLGKIVVCRRGEGAQLYQLTEQGWTRFSGAIQGKEFRCAVEGDKVAVISDSAIYVRSMSSTTSSSLTSLGVADFHVGPAAALLTEDSILIAYDRGEFGAALYWVELSHPTPATKLLDDHVRFLVRSPSGTIWAASGIGHLGYEHGALYRLDRPTPDRVASISGYVMTPDEPRILEKSGVDFPALTRVAGLAFGDSDRPIVVFPELGVFELGNDRFIPRYRGSLRFDYRASFRGRRYYVGSAPVGAVMTASGDLYIASRSLGVFLIRGSGQETSIKQLLFAPVPKPPQKRAP